MSKSSSLKYFHFLSIAIILSYFFVPGYSNFNQPEDSLINKRRTFDAEDLIRGERLFYGLIYLENKSINCAKCHNTVKSDSLNWNPDAVEIAEKYKNKSITDFSKVLLTPTGQKMAQAHRNFQFTPEDIQMIKAYMDLLPGIGLKQEKPVITNLILFIIASLLFLASTVDLIITKRLRSQWINLLILTITSVFITWTLVVDAIALGRSPDYSPDQPIKFSHQVHAGQNGISCIYCHSYAPYSKSAGIPPENVCMNCHLLVRNGSRTGAFEIAKIVSAYEKKKPVEWIRVHNLPDHVFFSHAQHVGAGGIDCKECHGAVEKMILIKQVAELSMGWCINCHRTKKVNFRENKFYSEYKDLADRVKKGELETVPEVMLGGTECMKCHY